MADLYSGTTPTGRIDPGASGRPTLPHPDPAPAPGGSDRPPARVAAPAKGGGHRRDIEGLRALSILMVMVWHAGVTWIPGGFVSLDVFFVISGFLITQLLVSEFQANGRIRLRRFYGRRAKRLLPAPTVVLLVIAVLTPLFLPRTRWDETAQDIIATALYVMNWRLAAQSTDYFQQDAATNSVLEHFWSLSAEEQFYILWPWLLAAIAGAVWKRGSRSVIPALLGAFALVGIPSFAWSVYYSSVSSGAYFVTTARAWEFALGGAFAVLTFTTFRLPRPVAIVVGWASLATIFIAAVLITTEFPYPSYWALIPCLATAGVIVAGFSAGGAGPVALLGIKPMQMVGRMSYSLYLCHWPVVAFTAAMAGRVLTVTEGLLAVAASVPLAYLLYRFVENPIRYSKRLFTTSPQMLRAAAVTTVVTITAGMGLQLTNWPAAPPFVAPVISTLASDDQASDGAQTSAVDPATGVDLTANPTAVVGAAVLGTPPGADPDGQPRDTSAALVPGPLVAHDDYTDCTQSLQSAEVRTCTYGERDSDKTIAVVGDSHANQWVPGIVEVAEARGWRVVEYTKAACSFTDVLISTKEGQPYTSCQEWSRAVLDRLLGPDKPTMVITSALKKRVFIDGQIAYQQEGLAALAEGLRRHYQALNAAGIPVVVIKDSPTPQVNVADCVAANPETLTACAGDRAAMLPADHSAEQYEAIEGLPQTRMIDLNDAICPADRCSAVIGNVLLYRDASHLTGTYVRTLAPRLDTALHLDQP